MDVVRARTGTQLSARGWPQQAALRMLSNNLDPDVAERPQDLVPARICWLGPDEVTGW